jgi:hypothetical protein
VTGEAVAVAVFMDVPAVGEVASDGRQETRAGTIGIRYRET